MEVTFLGTGTSQGIPMIGCACAVCTSQDERNQRTRTSVHVVMDGLHVQVDAAPEFRIQCVKNRIAWIDLFILTHGHADHVVGMDDLRRFCDLQGGVALPVYGSDDGLARVKAVFPYALLDRPAVRGYAAFKLHAMPAAIELPAGTIESTQLPHGAVTTLGLVFTERSSGRRVAYYTDCKEVPLAAVALARNADVVILDGLRNEPHPSHMTVSEALEAAKAIKGKLTFLVHMAHTLEHAPVNASLPSGISLAYDGLRVNLSAL